MPQAEDTWETQTIQAWVEQKESLQAKLQGMTAKELERFFDPLEERKGPQTLYITFTQNKGDWGEVDWEAIQECLEECTGVYATS